MENTSCHHFLHVINSISMVSGHIIKLYTSKIEDERSRPNLKPLTRTVFLNIIISKSLIECENIATAAGV